MRSLKDLLSPQHPDQQQPQKSDLGSIKQTVCCYLLRTAVLPMSLSVYLGHQRISLYRTFFCLHSSHATLRRDNLGRRLLIWLMKALLTYERRPMNEENDRTWTKHMRKSAATSHVHLIPHSSRKCWYLKGLARNSG